MPSQRVRNNQRARKAGGATPAAKLKFVVSTSGHEDVYFTTRSTNDDATYQDTGHVATTAKWEKGPMLAKAMTELRDPVFALYSCQDSFTDFQLAIGYLLTSS